MEKNPSDDNVERLQTAGNPQVFVWMGEVRENKRSETGGRLCAGGELFLSFAQLWEINRQLWKRMERKGSSPILIRN